MSRTSLDTLARNWSDDCNTMTATEAIDEALSAGYIIGKYADPTEGERIGLTSDEAHEVAASDVSLLWAELPA